MGALTAYPLLELDPDVCCSRSCGRQATHGIDLDATTDGVGVAELFCEPCAADKETT